MQQAFAIIVAAAVAQTITFGAAPAHAANYDGKWSVLIVTEKGDCDRAYRYDIAVANGRVTYAGEGSFDLSGTVSQSGAVKVSISKGGQSANGSGKLSGNSGGGSWRGRASSGDCSGRWEAERR